MPDQHWGSENGHGVQNEAHHNKMNNRNSVINLLPNLLYVLFTYSTVIKHDFAFLQKINVCIAEF